MILPMIKHKPPQYAFQMICLEDYVPKDHLLRKIDRYIDFSFIEDLTHDLYCHDNGRPAIHPISLFKMLFIGYLFGIRSERRLVQEIEVNLAYRWFIGYDLDDKIPNHSTFSQARRLRFIKRPELVREIFDNIVRQCINYGLIDGKVLFTDSTHIKANANKGKFDAVIVKEQPMAYLAELDREVDAIRQAEGRKPFDRDDDASGHGKSHEIKRSKTDPDSGFMTRDGKPKGFFYLDHRTVDGMYGLIVDSHVTPGNINDARPYPSRVRYLRTHFGFNIHTVGIDAGYKTTYIAKFLSEMGIYGVTGYKRPIHQYGMYYPREYQYDKNTQSYTCPQGHRLNPGTLDRRGYRIFSIDAKICQNCPTHHRCTASPSKKLFRHIWQDKLEELDRHRLTPYGKKIYKRRKETVERSFADSKEMHGLRYAQFRGLLKVQMQCLLVAICQNMKKMALVLSRRDDKSPFLRLKRVLKSFSEGLQRFFTGRLCKSALFRF